MMWLTVTVSVFTITSAIKMPNADVKTVMYNSPVPLMRSSINSNNAVNNPTQYAVYLPQIKKYVYLDNPKTRSRPSNLEKTIPNFKSNFQDLDGDRRKTLSTLQKSKRKKGKKREAKSLDRERNDDEFVPTQMLSQTRQSNSDQYLSPHPHEPHLREAIKDTKVHIEYTEEGYEDIGYDHADEEKQEESNEGYRSDRIKGQTQIDVEKEFDNYEKNYGDEVAEETRGKIALIPHPKRRTRFTKDHDYSNAKKDLNIKKYPYYKLKELDKNSALRYASNVQNIPEKIQNDLSFYKHTGAFKCSKIPSNINPLPDIESTSPSSILTGPRLKNLGEKIMCLATKYFGTDPLDNPLFTETNIETPQPFAEMRRGKRSLTSDAQIIKKNDLEEALPESAPLRLRKRRRKFPVPLQRPVFFGSSYFPTSMPPVLMFSPTIIPKYKTISEVYYKDEIQPNEQLNVFADVMNNIKQIRTDLISADTELVEDQTLQYETKNERNKVKIRVPTKKIKIRQSSAKLPEVPIFITTTTSTEKIQTRRRNNMKNHKTDPQVYEEYLHTIKSVKEKQPQENKKIKQSLNEETNNDVLETELEEVIGLSPPTVEFPTLTASSNAHIILNTFPVSGMKPPVNRNPLIYSDFKNLKRFKNNFHVVRKRSPQKPAYSEIRRTKTQQTPEVEEDDYVPKRNRNFHYDTNSKQVIYTKPESKENEEESDSEEPTTTTKKYVEKSISTELQTTSTTVQTGPSFLDYVNQLKASKQYQHIMEPTEKPKEVTTTTTEQYTTSHTNSVTPDYLNIVSSLKKNDGYVAIPEKKKEVTTKTPDVEERVEDSQELQIFDINEYLPKQDLPSVTIDYSKYKTIQRKPVKHNDEEEEKMASSRQESVITEPSAEQSTTKPTTTTEVVLTTTKKIRTRTRRRPIATTEKSAEPSSSTPPRQTRRRFRSTTQATTDASSETTVSTEQPKRRRKPVRSLETNRKLPSNHKEVYTPIKGLDVETKDETTTQAQKESASTFYSDATLPESVNQLKELNRNVNVAQQPDDIKEIQPKTEDPNLNNVRIIKDPSKRLYYYAPVR